MGKTTAFTGSIPANYENFLGPFLFEPYALDLIFRLQHKKYDDILEIACGTGRVTAHLAKSVKFNSLVATDLNPDMIEVAKEKVRSNKIKWMQANAMDLPFVDRSFDLVVMQFGIMFFPDKQKGLNEAYRVLKPKGKLIFSTWDKPEAVPAIYKARKIIESFLGDDLPVFYDIPYSMHNEKELRSLTEAAEFKDVKVSLVKKEGISSSATQLTKGIVEGNPIYLIITEKDPSLINIIEDQIAKELAAKFGEQVKSPLQAWVIEANR
ncbi:MAG TPA: class I SAM-dependent methyltransferase [Chitinophagaceae bacterium]|nr:class I SAM-dependent methyltransferase [Chitinophagaceae bacterium]